MNEFEKQLNEKLQNKNFNTKEISSIIGDIFISTIFKNYKINNFYIQSEKTSFENILLLNIISEEKTIVEIMISKNDDLTIKEVLTTIY